MIDTNKDGLITFKQYMRWIKDFLAVLKYYGVLPDIDNKRLGGVNRAILDEESYKTKIGRVIPFKFSSYGLAKRVRERTLQLVEKFDDNKNKNLEDNEIVIILQKLLNSDKFDIFYVQANVFRYDANSDGLITYDEMTDFFVEMHFGEMALQRLHKVSKYEKGDLRVMNEKEFIHTMMDSLKYISLEPIGDELHVLFTEIDQDHDG